MRSWKPGTLEEGPCLWRERICGESAWERLLGWPWSRDFIVIQIKELQEKDLVFTKWESWVFPLSPPPRAPPASCLGARENFLLLLNALVLDELNREKYLFSLNTVCSVPIRVFSVDVFPQHAMTVISPMYDFQEWASSGFMGRTPVYIKRRVV